MVCLTSCGSQGCPFTRWGPGAGTLTVDSAKTRHSANLAATHPERTSLDTRGRTPSDTRRWALRAASPARHPDAQGARIERQAAREDWLQSRRPRGRGMMRAWSCSGSRKLSSRARSQPLSLAPGTLCPSRGVSQSAVRRACVVKFFCPSLAPPVCVAWGSATTAAAITAAAAWSPPPHRSHIATPRLHTRDALSASPSHRSRALDPDIQRCRATTASTATSRSRTRRCRAASSTTRGASTS